MFGTASGPEGLFPCPQCNQSLPPEATHCAACGMPVAGSRPPGLSAAKWALAAATITVAVGAAAWWVVPATTRVALLRGPARAFSAVTNSARPGSPVAASLPPRPATQPAAKSAEVTPTRAERERVVKEYVAASKAWDEATRLASVRLGESTDYRTATADWKAACKACESLRAAQPPAGSEKVADAQAAADKAFEKMDGVRQDIWSDPGMADARRRFRDAKAAIEKAAPEVVTFLTTADNGSPAAGPQTPTNPPPGFGPAGPPEAAAASLSPADRAELEGYKKEIQASVQSAVADASNALRDAQEARDKAAEALRQAREAQASADLSTDRGRAEVAAAERRIDDLRTELTDREAKLGATVGYFQEATVSRSFRDELPVVEAGGGVSYLPYDTLAAAPPVGYGPGTTVVNNTTIIDARTVVRQRERVYAPVIVLARAGGRPGTGLSQRERLEAARGTYSAYFGRAPVPPPVQVNVVNNIAVTGGTATNSVSQLPPVPAAAVRPVPFAGGTAASPVGIPVGNFVAKPVSIPTGPQTPAGGTVGEVRKTPAIVSQGPGQAKLVRPPPLRIAPPAPYTPAAPAAGVPTAVTAGLPLPDKAKAVDGKRAGAAGGRDQGGPDKSVAQVAAAKIVPPSGGEDVAAREKAAREKEAQQQAAQSAKAADDRAARAKAEQEKKVEQEKVAQELAAKRAAAQAQEEKARQARQAAETAAAREKAEAERRAKLEQEQQRAAREKAVAEQAAQAAKDRAAREAAMREQAAREQAAREQAIRDRAARAKAEQDRAAAQKAQAEQARQHAAAEAARKKADASNAANADDDDKDAKKTPPKKGKK